MTKIKLHSLFSQWDHKVSHSCLVESGRVRDGVGVVFWFRWVKQCLFDPKQLECPLLTLTKRREMAALLAWVENRSNRKHGPQPVDKVCLLDRVVPFAKFRFQKVLVEEGEAHRPLQPSPVGGATRTRSLWVYLL